MFDFIIWWVIPALLIVLNHILFYILVRLYISLSDANEIMIFPGAPTPLERSKRR